MATTKTQVSKITPSDASRIIGRPKPFSYVVFAIEQIQKSHAPLESFVTSTNGKGIAYQKFEDRLPYVSLLVLLGRGADASSFSFSSLSSLFLEASVPPAFLVSVVGEAGACPMQKGFRDQRNIKLQVGINIKTDHIKNNLPEASFCQREASRLWWQLPLQWTLGNQR